MDSKYIFDPEGDTLLLLKNSDDPYTILGCDYIPRRRQTVWSPIGPQLGVYREPRDANRDSESSYHEDVEEKVNEEEILMRVSSKHLTLTSRYWKAALSETWRGPRQPGKVMQHEVQKYDVNSMVTLMNIIHGHGNKVTRAMSIEELVLFAVIMDYFECAEICSPYTEIWMEHIIQGEEKNDLPLSDSLQALWAFRLLGHQNGADFFKQNSIRTMKERAVTPFLPGTKQLIAEIDCLRVKATRRLVTRLLRAVREVGCCESCFHDPSEKFHKLLWSYKIYDAKKERVLYNCSINTIEHVASGFKVVPCTCLRPEKLKRAIARVLKMELVEG